MLGPVITAAPPPPVHSGNRWENLAEQMSRTSDASTEVQMPAHGALALGGSPIRRRNGLSAAARWQGAEALPAERLAKRFRAIRLPPGCDFVHASRRANHERWKDTRACRVPASTYGSQFTPPRSTHVCVHRRQVQQILAMCLTPGAEQ